MGPELFTLAAKHWLQALRSLIGFGFVIETEVDAGLVVKATCESLSASQLASNEDDARVYIRSVGVHSEQGAAVLELDEDEYSTERGEGRGQQ